MGAAQEYHHFQKNVNRLYDRLTQTCCDGSRANLEGTCWTRFRLHKSRSDLSLWVDWREPERELWRDKEPCLGPDHPRDPPGLQEAPPGTTPETSSLGVNVKPWRQRIVCSNRSWSSRVRRWTSRPPPSTCSSSCRTPVTTRSLAVLKEEHLLSSCLLRAVFRENEEQGCKLETVWKCGASWSPPPPPCPPSSTPSASPRRSRRTSPTSWSSTSTVARCRLTSWSSRRLWRRRARWSRRRSRSRRLPPGRRSSSPQRPLLLLLHLLLHRSTSRRFSSKKSRSAWPSSPRSRACKAAPDVFQPPLVASRPRWWRSRRSWRASPASNIILNRWSTSLKTCKGF